MLLIALLLQSLLPVQNNMTSDKASAQLGGVTEQAFVYRNKPYSYWLYLPKNLNPQKPAPVILFLHGAGEREGGLKNPSEVGIGPHLARQGSDFPFIVIMPRLSKNGFWRAEGPDAQRALRILDHVSKNYSVDETRLYLTGNSMGGHGTWELAIAYPEKWAAVAPICGFFGTLEYAAAPKLKVEPYMVKPMKDLPCWCFHGDQDSTVDVKYSRHMINALRSLGGQPVYTEYPGVGHNCWDMAYADPALYRWFLSQKRR